MIIPQCFPLSGSLLVMVALLLPILFSNLIHADILPEKILSLARGGAVELAIATVEQKQAQQKAPSLDWLEWEKLRFAVLELDQRWQVLIDRVDEDAKTQSYQSLDSIGGTYKAKALINLGRVGEARTLLHRLISTHSKDSTVALQKWHIMEIESYVEEGAFNEAQEALSRYSTKYKEQSTPVLLLEARLAVVTGDVERVNSLLIDQNNAEAEALKLLVTLKSEPDNVTAIMDKAELLASQPNLPNRDRARFWSIGALAAGKSGKPIKQAALLEGALGLPLPPRQDPLFLIDADMLWNAYLAVGKKVAEEKQLIVDDNGKAWLEAAIALDEETPELARALYSVLILGEITSSEYQNIAHQRLVTSLLNVDNGQQILATLYLQSEYFSTLDNVPPLVRTVLVEHLFDQQEVRSAAEMLEGIDAAEPVDEFLMGLLQSRSDILQGRKAQGMKRAEELLVERGPFGSDQVSKLIILGLDLQATNAYEDSVAWFEKLADLTGDSALAYEVRILQAEVFRKLGKPADAARSYLLARSLMENDDVSKFNEHFLAADLMREAGLLNDAKRIYTQLLELSEDPDRRRLLQVRLRNLFLPHFDRQAPQDNPQSPD